MRKSLIAAVMAGVILFGSIPESTFAETTAAEGGDCFYTGEL